MNNQNNCTEGLLGSSECVSLSGRTKAIILPEKPRRPLSAYNLFFRLERSRIGNDNDAIDCIGMQEFINITEEDVAKISTRQRYSDGLKRQHRKNANGLSLGFNELTRHISNKWKQLPTDVKILFEKRASAEKRRYQEEMKVWKRHQTSSMDAVTNIDFTESTTLAPVSNHSQQSKGEHSTGSLKKNELVVMSDMEILISNKRYISSNVPDKHSYHVSTVPSEIAKESMRSMVTASTYETVSSHNDDDSVSFSICDDDEEAGLADDYGRVSTHTTPSFSNVMYDTPPAAMEMNFENVTSMPFRNQHAMFSSSENYSERICATEHHRQPNRQRPFVQRRQTIDHLPPRPPQLQRQDRIFDLNDLVPNCMSAYPVNKQAYKELIDNSMRTYMYDDERNDARFHISQSHPFHRLALQDTYTSTSNVVNNGIVESSTSFSQPSLKMSSDMMAANRQRSNLAAMEKKRMDLYAMQTRRMMMMNQSDVHHNMSLNEGGIRLTNMHQFEASNDFKVPSSKPSNSPMGLYLNTSNNTFRNLDQNNSASSFHEEAEMTSFDIMHHNCNGMLPTPTIENNGFDSLRYHSQNDMVDSYLDDVFAPIPIKEFE